MPARSPLYSVPEPDADAIIQEVMIQAEAKKRANVRTFDPELGSSWEEAEERLALIRSDVNEYGKYVFGLEPARFHRLWNEVADDVINRRVPQNKVLFLAPPNTAKSTWNSLIRPTFYLGQHPDHNLLFFTSSEPMSRTFHSAVESVLRDNEKYRRVFPDRANRPNRARGWSSDGLYLHGTPPLSKDGAYRSVGFGASVMGARANGIIIDDPMNQEQAKSEAEQRRAKEYSSQTVMRRLQPGEGWVIAVMTRFHENDLASHYIKLAEEDAGWIVVRLPQIATNDPVPDPLGRETGELLWPERLTEAYVRAEQKEMTIAEFNLVHQCLEPGTPIFLTSLPRTLYRRWYEGPFVEIRTSGGQRLAGTPNHPVLTTHGWVPLDQITEGVYVVRGSLGDVVLSGGDDVDHGYPTISEVFEAAVVARQPELRAASEQDFHGDGFHPQVEVVDIDGPLVDRLQAQFPKLISEAAFGGLDQRSPALVRFGPDAQLLSREATAVDLAVSSPNTHHVAFRTLALDAIKSSLALASQRHSGLAELVSHRPGRNAVPLSQLCERLPVSISLDQVVQVVRHPVWSGHVFNLQSADHKYIAGGIVTHNCDPTGMGGDIFESEEWFQGLPGDFWSAIMPSAVVVQFWDLAYSDKKKTCYTVGITAAVDADLNVYVLHVVRKRMNTGDTENEMVKTIQSTRPMVVGIETDKFHQTLIVSLARRIMDRVMCNIQLIKPQDDKTARALLPAGRAQAGKLFVNKDAPWYRTFVTECLGFPNMRYKDQVDALSGVVLLAERLGQITRTSRRIEVEHVMAS